MRRFFNTTGPCDPAAHYMLPAEGRLEGLDLLVERNQYFVVHAARQTGKTTAMRAFAARLRGEGVAAVFATVERSQGTEEVALAEAQWTDAIAGQARAQLPPAQHPPSVPEVSPGLRLSSWLADWCAALAPARLVLFLDEADVLAGAPLVSLLRQLRAGFPERPSRFPASVGLVGMRDLRDYLVTAKDGHTVNPGSPFNVKAESITLRTFTEAEVGELYGQHAADTGQRFEPAAVSRAFHYTQGQPFLVNKLAATCVDKLVTDRGVTVTAADVDRAKEDLVLSLTTHLDSLAARLDEPRVAAVISRVLAGADDVPGGDDYTYCVDLGLLAPVAATPAIANPLYREVVARELSLVAQRNLLLPAAPWLRPDGTLDAPVLVSGFLSWWRENSDFAARNTPEGYAEALVHLAFMAFLQKVVNGGGHVYREYAAGTGRVDLCVDLAGRRTVVELKRVRPGRESPERVLAEGVGQLSAYLDQLGETEGWLLVFDQRPGRSWDERLWSRDEVHGGRTLHLRGA